jgi:hypothetical protein
MPATIITNNIDNGLFGIKLKITKAIANRIPTIMIPKKIGKPIAPQFLLITML